GLAADPHDRRAAARLSARRGGVHRGGLRLAGAWPPARQLGHRARRAGGAGGRALHRALVRRRQPRRRPAEPVPRPAGPARVGLAMATVLAMEGTRPRPRRAAGRFTAFLRAFIRDRQALAGLGLVALFLRLAAGHREGMLDHLIMRVLDVFFAFPLVLLAIAIVGVIGPGVGNQMFALAVVLVPYSTRVVRTATLSVKNLEYIEAVRALGAGNGRVLWRHLVPNVLPPLLVYTSTLVGLMIVASSGLSFLGLGVQPPTPDWGVMVGSGRLVIYRAAHVATIPGVIIVVVALGFNFIGDGLREGLEPRARH